MGDTSLLADVKTVVEIVGTLITATALIVGGLWAYFKFVKGRTYRPRLEVGMSARWRYLNGRNVIQARVRVRNIGGSVVSLIQKGTGLRVSILATAQDPPPAAMAWTSLRVFEVLREHEWIEPGEIVSDDTLLDLGLPEPRPLLFEARLVWQWAGRPDAEVVVFARQMMPVGSILDGSQEIPIEDSSTASETAHGLATTAGPATTTASTTAATAARGVPAVGS